MHRKTTGLLAALLAAGWILSSPVAAAPDKAALDAAFTALPKHDWGQSREALNAIDEAIVASHGNAAARKALETRLAAVLGGEATRAAKQFVCRKLAIIGTDKSVVALAGLLDNEELSHMARYALERLPGDAAGQALRGALGKVKGNLKVGVINSLGARADTTAVGSLVGLLDDSDNQVVAAAAAALGRIGAAEAAGPLAMFLTGAPKELQTAAIDANLDLAQRLAKKGDNATAGKIYDKFYAEGNPSRVRRAALQGLAMVRPSETAPLILKALGSDDAAFRGLAANMIKEMPAGATQAFADALPKLPEGGQVALLEALAARKDAAAARPAVLKATKSKSAAVSVAALKALGAVGSAADVPLLLKTSGGANEEKATAARASLSRLGGEGVSAALVSVLSKGRSAAKVQAINALAARAAAETAPAIVDCIGDADADVRKAAIEATGVLGGEAQVAPLVAKLKAAKDGGERQSIGKALAAVCSRAREKASPAVIAGLSGADAGAQANLYDALRFCGGDKALSKILAGTKSSTPEAADGATRALCDWPGKEAIAPLLAIASGSSDEVHQILALRGVVRLARLPETPADEKWATLNKAMTLAKKTTEKKLVLGALRDVPTLDAFKLVAQFVSEKGLSEEAGAAAVAIADKVFKQDRELIRTTLETVVKNVRSNRTKGDAQKVLAKVAPKRK